MQKTKALIAACAVSVPGLLAGLPCLGEEVMDDQAAAGLVSRDPVWNYHNEAADHYSSLVLAAHYVRPKLNEPGAPSTEARAERSART